MDLRCPKCGSGNLHTDKRGFSTRNAIIGGILTGNVFVAGAAGAAGSNKIKITCLDCGKVFNVGEGLHSIKKEGIKNDINVSRRVTNRESKMYLCDCGKTFSSEKNFPVCPKCGSMMGLGNRAELNPKVETSEPLGCSGYAIIISFFAIIIFVLILILTI